MDEMNKDLPNFKLNEEEIPAVKVRSVRIQNLKGYKDYFFDFSDGDLECKSFACFHGPNGTGKTTILDVIQLIFSNFDNYDDDRRRAYLGKSVRNEDGLSSGIYSDEDFLVTAIIQKPSCTGHPEVYEIKINKNGFISDHPDYIKRVLYRLFFYARLDKELHQFQLNRDKWPIFKELTEAVTGFEIEEKKNVFDLSEDPVQADLLQKYVLGFWIKKPHEKISHTECSDGERKIIKSFSTLLNMEYTPKIICIDNITMHVELGRHIALINAIKKCFPDSQIFATTHSYRMSRNFGSKNQMYDLRLVTNPDAEECMLQLTDELEDAVSKLRSFVIHPDIIDLEIGKGEELLSRCRNGDNNFSLREESEVFIKRVVHLHIIDMFE